LKQQIIILFIFIVNVSATSPSEIDAQIARIKSAPESQRVALMNQFKRQLILMNQAERENAIARLRQTHDHQSIKVPAPTPPNLIYNLQSSQIEEHQQVEQLLQLNTVLPEITTPTVDNVPPSTQTPTEPIPEPSAVPNPTEPIPITLPSVTEPTAPSTVPITSTPTSEPIETTQPTAIPTSSTLPSTSDNSPPAEPTPTALPETPTLETPTTQPPSEPESLIPIEGGTF